MRKHGKAVFVALRSEKETRAVPLETVVAAFALDIPATSRRRGGRFSFAQTL